MPASKPATAFSFATNANFSVGNPVDVGQVNKVDPPAGNIAEGYNPGYGLTFQYLNAQLNKIGLWTAYLRDFEQNALTWAAAQIFQSTIQVGDAIQSFIVQAVVVDWSLFLDGNFGNNGHVRLYYSQGKFCLTRNAFYTVATQLWAQDNTGLNATRIYLTNDAFDFQYHVALAGTWAEAAWADTLNISGVTSVATFIQNIYSTNGNISVQNDVTSRAGNVVASAGMLTGQHLVSNSGTPTGSIGANGGAGGGGSAPVTGTDISGKVTVTSGAAPTSGVICRVTFARTYSPAPSNVVIVPRSALAWALADDAQGVVGNIDAGGTYFEINNAGAGALGAGAVYGWSYILSG